MSQAPPFRYRSGDEDSARWWDFPYREGDIVISTRSKSGTTWMQMICALLVFQTAELPQPLGVLSPWLDWLGIPRPEIYARLAVQEHRRIIKTHTPLDGVPLHPGVTYIVMGRHPLDMAVSLYHHGANIDRRRLHQLTGQASPSTPPLPRPTLHEWLLDWIDTDAAPADQLDALPGVLWHASDAWARRHQPNVVLVHYDDLSADLDGEMHRLAHLLGITVPGAIWPELIAAARFDAMKARADDTAPDPADILKDHDRFFRRGTSGAGREVLSSAEMAHYADRVDAGAGAEVVAWLHHHPSVDRGRSGNPGPSENPGRRRHS